MAKKYKILTVVLSFVLVLSILGVSVFADSITYESEETWLYYYDTDIGDDLLNRRHIGSSVTIDHVSSTWGFMYDIDFKKHHTYTVDIVFELELPEGTSGVSIPTLLDNVTFFPYSSSVVGATSIGLENVVFEQVNSSGTDYVDLVSFSHDNYYDEVKEVNVCTFTLAFSTANGFIDNLPNGEYYMFPYYIMHPDALEIDYRLTYYGATVTSVYDPKADAYQQTVVDQMGQLSGQLTDVKTSIDSLGSQLSSENSKQLNALKAVNNSITFLIQETQLRYEQIVEVKKSIDALPEQFGDQIEQKLEEHDDKQQQKAQDSGNKFLEQLTSELVGVVDSEGVVSAFDNVLSFVNYDGRVSMLKVPAITIPAMTGVLAEPLQIWGGSEIKLHEYVDMLPDDILTVVQWGVVVLIVISAVFSLMKLISQFLEGKSVGSEDGGD